MSDPKLDDVDYFFPDPHLVSYYKKVLVGLEERVVSVKQKIAEAEASLLRAAQVADAEKRIKGK